MTSSPLSGKNHAFAVTMRLQGLGRAVRTSLDRPTVATTLLVLLLLLVGRALRSPNAFLRPLILFEDGLFLTHFWGSSWHDLGWRYAGYAALGPNAVAWLTQFLPLQWLRYVQSTSALVVGVLPSVVFLSPRAAPLFPSWRQRAILAAFVAWAPLGDWVFSSLNVYSNWSWLLATALIAALPTASTIRAELPWLVLSSMGTLSHPLAILCVPVWWFRALLERRLPSLVASLALSLLALGYHWHLVDHGQVWHLKHLLSRFASTFSVAVLGEMMAGREAVIALCAKGLAPLLYTLAGLTVSVVAGMIVFRLPTLRWSAQRWLFLLATVWFTAAVPLASLIVRGGPGVCDTDSDRYFYLSQILLSVAVVAIGVWRIEAPRARLAATVALLVWCVVTVGANRISWKADSGAGDVEVMRFMRDLRQAAASPGGPQEVRMERGDWSVILRVPLSPKANH